MTAARTTVVVGAWIAAVWLSGSSLASCSFRLPAASDDAAPGPDDAPREVMASDADGGDDGDDGDDACAMHCGTIGGACDPTTRHCIVSARGKAAVVCPAGVFCEITCDDKGDTCEAGVDCSAAAGCIITCGRGGRGTNCANGPVRCPLVGPCTVRCDGDEACRNADILCGDGACDVHCIGAAACEKGVTCGPSTNCTAECRGASACHNGGVRCGDGICTAICDGAAACDAITCGDATPTTCAFHCCGDAACTNATLCSGCTRDEVCN